MRTSSVLLVILFVVTFPIWMGLVGGLFGMVFGLIGGIFGLIGGLFGLVGGIIGAIFGAIAAIFEGIFHLIFGGPAWDVYDEHHFHLRGFGVVVLIIGVALLIRARQK